MKNFRKLMKWFYCTKRFLDKNVPGNIWLLLVSPSGSETMAYSRIYLYCCWSSNLPESFYTFLMFSRHLCSYRALLLNDWSTPMVKICCFSCSDCNSPLIMTNLCLKYLIEIINSITLVNYIDFYTVRIDQFFRQFKNKDNILHTYGVFEMSFYVWYCVEITVHTTLMEHGRFLKWQCDCVYWGLQKTVSFHHQWYSYLTCLWCVSC